MPAVSVAGSETSRTAHLAGSDLNHPERMEESPRCPCCSRVAWVRGNVVVVAGAGGPLRVTTNYPHGPARWSCANCGYEVPLGETLEVGLAQIPMHGGPFPAVDGAA